MSASNTWNSNGRCDATSPVPLAWLVMPLLGAHQSIAGGLHLAFDRIKQVEGASLQIFTANQRQWRSAPLQPEVIQLFQEKWQENGLMPVASHT
jgi:deoxyribonuclease-4